MVCATPQFIAPRTWGLVPREVDLQFLAADGDGHRDRHGDARVDAVVVHRAGRAVRTVGQGADERARLALAVVEDRGARGVERVEPPPVDDLAHPGRTDPHGGGHRLDVPGQLVGAAAVAAQDVEDVRARPVLVEHPHRPEPQSLLVDARGGHASAGLAAAHVDHVRTSDRVADQSVVVEDRRERRAVLQVRALKVGVVEQEDVAGPHRPRTPAQGDRVRDGLAEVAQEDRQPGRQRDDLGVAVEQADRAVLALVDRRRVGGPDEREAHVLGRGEHAVADDLERRRIGRCHAFSSVLVRRTVPLGPGAAVHVGGTKIVDPGSWTTAVRVRGRGGPEGTRHQ